MALGVIAGLSTPPVQSAVRTIYPKMVNSRQLTPLFSLDASLQEIIWIVAPVLITFVATQVGTVQALLLIVVILIGGGAWFILSPEVGRVRIPRSRRSIGKVLTKPAVLLATVIGFLLIGACAAVEAGVVATFGHDGLEAGHRAGALLDRQPRRAASRSATSRSAPGRWRDASRSSPVGLALTMISLERLVARRHAHHRGHRHRARPRGAVRDDVGERQVQRHGRSLRVGRHRAAHRRRGRIGDRRLPDRRRRPAGRVLRRPPASPSAGSLVAVVFVRGFPDLRGRDPSPIPDTEPVGTIT